MSEDPIPQEGVLDEGDFQKRRAALFVTSKELLQEDDLSTLRLILNNQHPSDLAELLTNLPEADRVRSFPLIAVSLAAATLTETGAAGLIMMIEELSDRTIATLVEHMEPDDAADILSKLTQDRRGTVMAMMTAGATQPVEELLPHGEDTGGGLMTPRLVALREEMTVADAIEYLRAWASEDEVFYPYVVDEGQRLIGTAPLRRLLLAERDTRIGALLDPNVMRVSPEMDQEEIAHIFSKYNLLALPVVNEEGILVGRITIDDIVEVIEEEATEDIYEMAAMSSEELEERSVFGVVKRRVPWLLVCLAGTMLSGGVIDYFSTPLGRTITTLMLFVPTIMAMGGNSGVQTSTVTVRNMAIGDLQPGTISVVVFRELRIALTMGLLLGGLVYVVARLWTRDGVIAGCVSAAMCSSIVLAAALGALIPLFFNKVGVDPAVASGPLITTLNDGLSLILYFTISILLLSMMKPGAL